MDRREMLEIKPTKAIDLVSSKASASSSNIATHAIAPPANPSPTGRIGIK